MTTTKNPGTLEYLFSHEFLTTITMHTDYIDDNDKNFTPMLNLIIDLNREATSQYWNSFIDFAALFVEKLRTKKYDVLNLTSIPDQKKDRFKELLSYDRLKADFKLQQTFNETEAPPDFSILLPPGSRCFRQSGALSLVEITRDPVLSLAELYCAGAKVHAITTHLRASKILELCLYGMRELMIFECSTLV